MPARISSRPGAAPTPLGVALRTLAVALVVTGGLCVGVVLLVPESARARSSPGVAGSARCCFYW
ncbi:hypothetical protein ACO0M4_39595 [Streptomyces sp. RGM 3693]|uniref:hypothetical protein n=1 Tax=Streptomyces sp. RGM 3693 TaxID=3413284 RepID=UPI003D2B2F55